ncbi:heterokaryon incompatibility protein het-E-1 [Fusarium coicis]|nr:heterokaryon incompatibility protein het-E-1 [Fusarium coicis]
MASNQQTSFERSLDLFRRELSDDQIKQMNGANQKTLNDTIQATQNILGRRNDLCKLTRIQKFLHGMEHVEKLVSIFLNASEFVAFVWGPIKLALMVATTWTHAVRQLIDAYEEIAEALGNLAFFHTLIQSRDHLKLVLEDYFSDILRFHRLQSHAILKEVQDSDQYAKDQFSSLQTSLQDIRSSLASEELQSKTLQAQEMKTYLESRLDVSKSRTDLQLESQNPILENSGSWIFSDPTFNSWERGNSQDGRVLFLNGSPGSGKSTLAKTIIRHQKQKQASESPGRSFLTYFFFKHDVADRRTARSMLQHVIMQLVNVDETIMRFAYERLSTIESTELADLKKLATDSITSRPSATLVLDGLDEAMGKEHEISISWCLDELLKVARPCGCDLKILLCGQRDGRLDGLLSSHPQIRLDMVDAHQNDIEQFTKQQAAKIRARFQLTDQEEESLITKISTTSQGMFLYAKVVLDNLALMDSIQEFEDELEGDTFPEDLGQASLVDVTNCDLFPNVESEQVVTMVHETATKYLIRNGTVNLLEEHVDMALFCCRYLSSRPFTTGKRQNISADIQSGYFGFLDYAAAHYTVHIQEVEASDVSTDPALRLGAVKAAAADLAKANCQEVPAQTGQTDKHKTTQGLELAIQDNVLAPLESHNEAFHHSESRTKVVFPSDLETGEWNLYEACKAGNLDEVKRFHREGADLKSTRAKIGSPLCTAVEAGHDNICQYLVDNRVDPFKMGSRSVTTRTPVAAAIYRERREILELFLHSGTGPDDSELASEETLTQ